MILVAIEPSGPVLHEYAPLQAVGRPAHIDFCKTSIFGPKSGFSSTAFQPSVLTRNGVHIRVGTVDALRLHIWIVI